ncbi:MAG: alpha/beta hydrolase [Proteobacteria bacterium]|nr:alpha/beta hydrolase [Pseudomonadota bacterium]
MASEKDVAFASVDGLELKLDVYRPAQGVPSTRTAVIFLHGGGWRGGAREAMRLDARALAELGFVGLPAQYRLLGQAPWPAQIHDVKAAIRWTRANAVALGVDAERIVLWGSSAGAHLALLAAGTPDDPRFEGEVGAVGVSSAVAAVIAVHPPTSFHVGAANGRHSTPATSLLGEGADEDATRAASPLSHVGAAFPPTLLLHGTQDRVVHHSASQAMMEALRAAGASVDLHLFHGHTHGFAALPSVRPRIASEAAWFLDRTIIDKARHDAETLEFSMFARRDAEARARSRDTAEAGA